MRRSSRRSLIALPTREVLAHPRFVALFTIWGAALLGCAVLAVSSVDVERISRLVGLGALGYSAKFLYAAIAAAIGAFVAFVAASLMQRFFEKDYYSRPPARLTDDRVRPIEPALDLGSESLDAPIEEMPFSASQDEFDDTFEEAAFEDAWVEADDESDATEPVAQTAAAEPLEDEEFVIELDAMSALEDGSVPVAELRDEDQVQIESPIDEEVEGPVDPNDHGTDMDALGEILGEETRDFEARRAARDEARRTGRRVEFAAVQATHFKSGLAPSGVAKLRETPTQDLSLIQLVERFAAALHEVQDKTPQEVFGANAAAGQAERERALAEALKALDLFTDGRADGAKGPENSSRTGHSPDGEASRLNEAERDLREALGKLQTLRGAA